MELLVKDCIIKRTLPNQFGSLAEGWEFIRYKIHDDSIIGASLWMEPDGKMRIKDYCFSSNQPPIPFASFAAENLCYTEPEKIHGSRDYLALKKDGNVYMIIDTDENMQILKSAKMDRMPRVRKVFILHKEDETAVENQIVQIMDMLRFGFGRWNEMMTYPFPFKFLQEYLDDACEVSFSKHWCEITAK